MQIAALGAAVAVLAVAAVAAAIIGKIMISIVQEAINKKRKG